MIESSWWLAGGLLAVALAVAVWLLVDQPWRLPSHIRGNLAYVAAVFAGFFGATVAHWAVKHAWPWPPRESAHFLLMVIVPGALVVQIIAAWPRVPQWLAWLLRGLLIAATPPVLLQALMRHQWSAGVAVAICAGLAAGIALVWVMLAWLAQGNPGRGPWLGMLITTAGAGVTLMSSGSITLGEMGLTLAAAVFGSALAGLANRGPQTFATGLPFAFLILASLLIEGRFYASMGTLPGVVLAVAPLTGWVACIPALRRRPWLAAAACVIACGIVVGAVTVPIALTAMHQADVVGENEEGNASDEIGHGPLWQGPIESTPDEGAVAQLGEHSLCKAGVAGSIPVRSISRDAFVW